MGDRVPSLRKGKKDGSHNGIPTIPYSSTDTPNPLVSHALGFTVAAPTTVYLSHS